MATQKKVDKTQAQKRAARERDDAMEERRLQAFEKLVVVMKRWVEVQKPSGVLDPALLQAVTDRLDDLTRRHLAVEKDLYAMDADKPGLMAQVAHLNNDLARRIARG